MVKIIAIPPQEVPAVFPHIINLIIQSMEYTHGEFDIDDLYKQLLTLQTVLWTVTNERYEIEAFAITDVLEYPKKKVIRILLLAGKGMENWKQQFTDSMVAWGAKIGASGIEVIGRKGWERALEKLGFNYMSTILLKEI